MISYHEMKKTLLYYMCLISYHSLWSLCVAHTCTVCTVSVDPKLNSTFKTLESTRETCIETPDKVLYIENRLTLIKALLKYISSLLLICQYINGHLLSPSLQLYIRKGLTWRERFGTECQNKCSLLAQSHLASRAIILLNLITESDIIRQIY